MKFPRIAIAASFTLAGSAAAQPLIDDPRATWSLLVENDSITREDDAYSSAAVISYMSGTREPQGFSKFLADNLLFPRASGELKARRGYSAGHLLYTPDDISVAEPIPNDYPYAAVLYGDTSWALQQRNRLDIFTFEVGAVGPIALGEEVQSFIHSVTRNVDPQGWDNQIGNELLLNLHYDLQYKMKNFEFAGKAADLVGTMNMSAGNRLTGLGGGAKVRWGSGLDQSFGPTRVRPGLTGSPFFTPTSRGSWHLFAGGDIRAVAHTIVLDNSFFRDGGPQRNSKTFVFDFQVGGVVQRGPYQFSLTLVARSAEFEEDEERQNFGSIALSRKF
ncbi:MAG: lipid A deacylase LpxR family protein [Parvularcula sp.]|jgi:hypothetical protein|nr:lipid A deacylase LpxR family protein [Parvularcula sp.]